MQLRVNSVRIGPSKAFINNSQQFFQALALVVKNEAESEPNEHCASHPIKRLDDMRPTQPTRKRAHCKVKKGKPEDALGRVNYREQHAERSHKDSSGNKLRQKCNVEHTYFRVEKIC